VAKAALYCRPVSALTWTGLASPGRPLRSQIFGPNSAAGYAVYLGCVGVYFAFVKVANHWIHLQLSADEAPASPATPPRPAGEADRDTAGSRRWLRRSERRQHRRGQSASTATAVATAGAAAAAAASDSTAMAVELVDLPSTSAPRLPRATYSAPIEPRDATTATPAAEDVLEEVDLSELSGTAGAATATASRAPSLGSGSSTPREPPRPAQRRGSSGAASVISGRALSVHVAVALGSSLAREASAGADMASATPSGAHSPGHGSDDGGTDRDEGDENDEGDEGGEGEDADRVGSLSPGALRELAASRLLYYDPVGRLHEYVPSARDADLHEQIQSSWQELADPATGVISNDVFNALVETGLLPFESVVRSTRPVNTDAIGQQTRRRRNAVISASFRPPPTPSPVVAAAAANGTEAASTNGGAPAAGMAAPAPPADAADADASGAKKLRLLLALRRWWQRRQQALHALAVGRVTRPQLEALLDRTLDWREVVLAVALALAVAGGGFYLFSQYRSPAATFFLCVPIAAYGLRARGNLSAWPRRVCSHALGGEVAMIVRQLSLLGPSLRCSRVRSPTPRRRRI